MDERQVQLTKAKKMKMVEGVTEKKKEQYRFFLKKKLFFCFIFLGGGLFSFNEYIFISHCLQKKYFF